MADRSDGDVSRLAKGPAGQGRSGAQRSQSSSQRPWRTEGLPEEGQGSGGPSWWRTALWFLAVWFLLFGLTTAQTVSSAQLATVPYTEFTDQVEAGNVREVFARGLTIEGVLEEPAEVPDGQGTYTQFATERPVFAEENLLSELERTGAVVRAQPVTTERGVWPIC